MADDGDDLDDFFNDIEEVEKEVKNVSNGNSEINWNGSNVDSKKDQNPDPLQPVSKKRKPTEEKSLPFQSPDRKPRSTDTAEIKKSSKATYASSSILYNHKYEYLPTTNPSASAGGGVVDGTAASTGATGMTMTATTTATATDYYHTHTHTHATTSSNHPLSSRSSLGLVGGVPPPPPPPPLPSGPPPPHLSSSSGGLGANANANANGNPHNDPSSTTVHKRSAAGKIWTDPTLVAFPANDFRLFVGNLAKDLLPHQLEQLFSRYPSFAMAKISYNKHDGKSRGYGFVSMMDPMDAARAVREMDQKWLGSRPIKVRMSDWKTREAESKSKEKNKKNKKKGRR